MSILGLFESFKIAQIPFSACATEACGILGPGIETRNEIIDAEGIRRLA